MDRLDLLLSDKMERDYRLDDEPQWTFTVVGDTFGVYLPLWHFWVWLSLLLALQWIICLVIGFVIYTTVIQQRHSKTGIASSTSLLIGYGCLLPTIAALPFVLIDALEIKNMALMMSVAAIPTLGFFRCLEALHNTSPEHSESSLVRYMLYYASVIEFEGSSTGTFQTPQRGEQWWRCLDFAWSFLLLGGIYSLLEATAYQPFGKRPPSLLLGGGALHWRHLGNNLLLAYLTHLCLHVGTLGVGIGITALTGCQVKQANHNPILGTESVSDFWGRRWNRLVHSVLKRGVYKSVRKHASRIVAAISVFVASGLLHEYVLSIIAQKNKYRDCEVQDVCYQPLYGAHLAFFAWNGALLVLEYTGGQRMPWLARHVPRPLRTLLVLLTVLPVAHWFTDEYVVSQFYSDYKVGFPAVVVLDRIK